MIEKIVKTSPLIGALLVFFGVLKLIFYYSYFNVQIIDYLEFQEIITSFFEDINILIVFGMTMMFITFSTFNTLSGKANLHIEDLAEKMLNFLYPHRFKCFFLFLTLFLILYGLIYFDIIQYNYFVIYILTFLVIQMLTYLFLSKDVDGEIDIPNIYLLIIMTISLSFSIFLLAQKDIQETVNNNIESRIKTIEDNIICNKETGNLYIGKTSKYGFFRIKKLKSTVVIPNEKITKYEFK
ncbi:conserved membrane hypothetical protein [Tenacibaculum maritimum]|uniref:hypothetical protein n=1 Tax=Tenacibaculum maritimum TaxID=107401 RepID=UPI0012E658B8|nr:hypothetical protein [Tenacibaculum maritimum]CAA0223549.1 conserved membrane hypothetical protein [Tenacibaculum maritimum]